MNLTKCKLNAFFVIDDFYGQVPTKIKRRLLDLGFTKGQRVKVLRKSILGKVFLVEIRKFVLSLREEVAQYVLVEGK